MRALILSLLFSSKLAAFEVPAFDYYNFSCLVRNAYHEARGESVEGLEAVTQVVLNRMRIKRKEACEIIYKPAQFSWTTVPPSVSESEYRVVEARLWARLVRHAPVFRRHGGRHVAVVSEQITMPILSATHYHKKSVKPKWARQMKRVAIIGAHIFYRS